MFNTPLQPYSISSNLAGHDSMSLQDSLQDSSNLAGQQKQGMQIEYDGNGFPILPERLQLRLNWQPPEDFPDESSHYN